MKYVLAGLLIGILATSAHASWIQYNTSTFQVVGAFATEADMRLDAETAPLEYSGVAVADIPWPNPSGCTNGRKDWTLVTSPGELPLVLNPTLTFFRCHPVANLSDLRAATLGALNSLAVQGTGLRKEMSLEVMVVLLVGGLQCVGNNSATCNSIRANNLTIFSHLGSAADVLTLQGSIITLYTEFTAAKNAHGW